MSLFLACELKDIFIHGRSRRDIVLVSSVRPSICPSVRATDMDLGAFLVVWR